MIERNEIIGLLFIEQGEFAKLVFKIINHVIKNPKINWLFVLSYYCLLFVIYGVMRC